MARSTEFFDAEYVAMSHLFIFLQQIILHTQTNYVALSHLFIFLQQIILHTETNYVDVSSVCHPTTDNVTY